MNSANSSSHLGGIVAFSPYHRGLDEEQIEEFATPSPSS